METGRGFWVLEEGQFHSHLQEAQEDVRNYRQVSLASISLKVMGQLILETICNHMKDKNMIKSS